MPNSLLPAERFSLHPPQLTVSLTALASDRAPVRRAMLRALGGSFSASALQAEREDAQPGLDGARRQRLLELLRDTDSFLVAHLYAPGAVQELALESGGVVADSLEMARAGARAPQANILVAGVRFMGETAKILSPDKRVRMLDISATCSLDLGCTPDAFRAFIADHPGREVVVYANTSAEIKACADWVVTSSIAREVIEHLHGQGKRILWAPDRHLGRWLREQTGADMQLWDGSCVVHEEFRAQGVRALLRTHPQAAVLAHPESPYEVLQMADVVGSTSQLLAAVEQLSNQVVIVATDRGMFHALRRRAPGKQLIPAPTAGEGASCRSCARCPWMRLNHLDALQQTLETGSAVGEVLVDPQTAERARRPLLRMLHFPTQQARSLGLPG